MYLNAKRGELENGIEDDIRRFAERSMVASPGEDDLKQAFDYNPAFFGGIFPTSGVEVQTSGGPSRFQDKPNRPREIRAILYVYDVAMPERGALSAHEDTTSRAKKNTRRVRDAILDELFKDPEYAAGTEIRENRSSIFNDFGFPMLDAAGSNILWVDRTDLLIQV